MNINQIFIFNICIRRSNIIVLSINLHSFINYYLSYKYMADPRFKIILVGDVSVGKTALFWRYTQGQFLANKDTLVTAVDFKMKNITIKEKPVKLYIWDTAGSEKYRSIVSTYFKGCQGVIIVFDLSRYIIFNIDRLRSEMQLTSGYQRPNPKHLEQFIYQWEIKVIQMSGFREKKQENGVKIIIFIILRHL